MTKPQTVLETTRRDAQDLHKKISANMAKAEHATWADVKAVQVDAVALATKMKTLATDQAEAVKTGIRAAVAKLDASAKLIENKAVSANQDIRHANASMLDSAHSAALSLSAAVAAARTKLAKAIAPKKAPAKAVAA